jgi:uncharacterized repeat protein (TIGR01451 family)
VVVTDKLPYDVVYLGTEIYPANPANYSISQSGDLIYVRFDQIASGSTRYINISVRAPEDAPATLYSTVNLKYRDDPDQSDNRMTLATYVPAGGYNQTDAAKSFEDLLHNQSQLLFQFEDLLHTIPDTNATNYSFLVSFEQLLRSQADLTGSFEELLTNESSTGWDAEYSKENRTYLLKSYRQMLWDEAFLFASFNAKINKSWMSLCDYTAEDHSQDAQTELIASFEDLLKRQTRLYKSFNLLLNKMEIDSHQDRVNLLAAYENLLRVKANLLMSFYELLEAKYKSRNSTNQQLLCISGYKLRSCDYSPVSDTTIILSGSDGQAISTTTTGLDGRYEFCGLWPGDYIVSEVVPIGWSEISKPGKISLAFTNATNQNFTNQQLLCISGCKIDSITGAGLANWTISLKKGNDDETLNTTTNETGYYQFCGLPPASYTICEVGQEGWTSSGEACRSAILNCSNLSGIDFSATHSLCIEGRKINNCTGEGLSNWTVGICNASGGCYAAKTNETGYFSFCNLTPGVWQVCESVESGWMNLTARCIDVNLSYKDVKDIELWNTPLYCISGYKLNDSADHGEIANWMIVLTNSTGEIGRAKTDQLGRYQFCNLEPGNYTVCEDIPAGWTNISSSCMDIFLDCRNETNINFTNRKLGPGILVNKTVSPPSGALSTNVTFLIEVTNTGDVLLKPVVVDDVLPTGLDYVSDNRSCKRIGQNISWTLPELKANESTYIELVAHINGKAFGVVWNKANAIGVPPTGDNVTDNDTEPVQVICCISGTKIMSEGLSPAGFKVEIRDLNGRLVATSTTAEDGSWSVCGLLAGNYTVSESPRDGWEIDPMIYEVKIIDDCGRSDLNFYYKPSMDPLQYGQYCEAKKIAGTGVIDIGTSAIDREIALEYSNVMSGEGDFELDQETAYSQVADKLKREIPSVSGSKAAALNLYQTNKLTYAGNTPLTGEKHIKSEELYGGAGVDIRELLSVHEIEQEQTAFFSSTTPYVPADNVSSEDLANLLKGAGRDIEAAKALMTDENGVYNPAHLIGLDTKNAFNGTWGTDASWHKIFYKDIRASEMFSGAFEVDKLIEFHEHPVPDRQHLPCEGIDC